MVFLETYLTMLCASLCHHSAAAKGGRLVEIVAAAVSLNIVPGLRRPARELPRQVRLGVVRRGRAPARRGRGRRRAEVAARIRHQPDAVAGVAAFLGGF